MKTRILFGIDFTGSNYSNALNSVQHWWQYLSEDKVYECMFGISNFCNRFESLPGASYIPPSDVLNTFTTIVPTDMLAQWTSDIDERLLEEVRKEGFRSKPFFTSFNYGSVNNRLLFLANSHDCEYLVRIDPGTYPPEGIAFSKLMDKHQLVIAGENRTAVSRRYANRLALRDMFVKPGLEEEHRILVKKSTGIDVHNQVTAGAMLTFNTPGTPAICFPSLQGLTLVWASDDGFFQVLRDTKSNSRVLHDYPVQRFGAVGKPKTSLEYYRGILGAVILNGLLSNMNRKALENAARKFIQLLKDEILDVARCSEMDQKTDWASSFTLQNIADHSFFDSIVEGYQNYRTLLEEWESICSVLKSMIVEETSAKKLIEKSAK